MIFRLRTCKWYLDNLHDIGEKKREILIDVVKYHTMTLEDMWESDFPNLPGYRIEFFERRANELLGIGLVVKSITKERLNRIRRQYEQRNSN